jgi:hypothetical protein
MVTPQADRMLLADVRLLVDRFDECVRFYTDGTLIELYQPLAGAQGP